MKLICQDSTIGGAEPIPAISYSTRAKLARIKSFPKAAAQIIGCDLEGFRQMPRVTKAAKDNREILVLSVWKIDLLGNDEIGGLFGMTYSSVSHIIKSNMMRMK